MRRWSWREWWAASCKQSVSECELSNVCSCGLRRGRGRALPPLGRVDRAHGVFRQRAQVLAHSPLSHLQQVRDRQRRVRRHVLRVESRSTEIHVRVVKGSLTAAEHAVRRLHLRDLRQFELELLLALRLDHLARIPQFLCYFHHFEYFSLLVVSPVPLQSFRSDVFLLSPFRCTYHLSIRSGLIHFP